MLPMLMTGTRSTGETVSEFRLGPDEKKYVFQCLRGIESVYRSISIYTLYHVIINLYIICVCSFIHCMNTM